MSEFAFITHLTKLSEYAEYFSFPLSPTLNRLCEENGAEYKRFILQEMENLEVGIEQIPSNRGRSIFTDGVIKFLPFFPSDFIRSNEQVITDYITSYCKKLAHRDIKIVGLGGFSSMLGDRGITLSKDAGISVTTGNSLTAATIVRSIESLIRSLDIDPSRLRLLIIGASGDIGSACTKSLMQVFTNITLVAREVNVLRQKFQGCSSIGSIVFSSNVEEAASNANIIISVTSSPIPIIDMEKLKPGTIVCDASFPANVYNVEVESLKQVLVYEGGKLFASNGSSIKSVVWKKFFPENIIFGCLAEAIVLSLEKRFESFSVGRGMIVEDRMNEVFALAQEHGFCLPPLKWGSYLYTKSDLENFKSILSR